MKWKERERCSTHLSGVRVEGILNVALPDNSQMTDGLDGHTSEEVVLNVGQRLRRSHHYTLPRVDTQRIHILHVTHLGGRVM